MAAPLPRSPIWALSFFLLLFVSTTAFYLPGSYPHKYQISDPLTVKVNSLTSIDTELPFSYYSLPFCQPLDGIRDSAENLGELLMGDRIESSPYKFSMLTNQSDLFLCLSKPLSASDLRLFRDRIDDMYQVNVILDNLPAIRYTKKDDGFLLRWTGYPIGVKVGDAYYVFNHLKFTVLVHKYEEPNVAKVMGIGDAAEVIPTAPKDEKSGFMVVGFEVVPCSVQHDLESVKNLKMQQKKQHEKKEEKTKRFQGGGDGRGHEQWISTGQWAPIFLLTLHLNHLSSSHLIWTADKEVDFNL